VQPEALDRLHQAQRGARGGSRAEKALLGGARASFPQASGSERAIGHGDSVVVVNEWSEDWRWMVTMTQATSGDHGLEDDGDESILGFRHDDEGDPQGQPGHYTEPGRGRNGMS